MQRFVEVTITSDSSDPFVTPRKAAIRVDEIVGVVDISAEKFIERPKTRLHLAEPTDVESESEAGGVVRSMRVVSVKEDYDTISQRIAEASQAPR